MTQPEIKLFKTITILHDTMTEEQKDTEILNAKEVLQNQFYAYWGYNNFASLITDKIEFSESKRIGNATVAIYYLILLVGGLKIDYESLVKQYEIDNNINNFQSYGQRFSRKISSEKKDYKKAVAYCKRVVREGRKESLRGRTRKTK